jgi:hypothetical protein
MVTGFSAQIQRTLATVQQRGLELAEASQRAEQAAQAEHVAREREEQAARQLRQTVQEYTAFLERVTAGDYSARLALDAGEAESPGELLILGRYLNDTVQTLVSALRDMEAIQRRYTREAWSEYTGAAAHRGFRYRDAAVGPADDAWLLPMTEAVQDGSTVTNPSELALPLALRGEVIGAIGVRRGEEAGWSDEDINLARAITDQLAQTIESLRLLDETQRRATRERLTGEVTARMRESLDMETVLKTAVNEMRQALGLEGVIVQLARPREVDDGTA